MNTEIDKILHDALTPTDEPDFYVNGQILNQIKENPAMKKQNKRIPAVVCTAALLLVFSSVTVVGAWKYLSMEQITEKTDNKKLQEAFLGKDAIFINETQSNSKYQITLLGIVSGDNISDFIATANGQLQSDRTYSVVAIEHTDGTPMPDISDDAYGEETFFVSPYIKGYSPAKYNAYTLSGGYTDFVEDGILYRVSECDNIELFADKGVYLGISDGTFYNSMAYSFDENSGEISANTAYEGLNALFVLPLDETKADAQAANDYIQKIDAPSEEY